jgi:predicted anti-sigma-YlaC factor YlaD
MLVLYVLLLGALALFTAYTRNFQRTIVGIGAALDSSEGAALAPRVQLLRTLGLLLAWPAALGLGMLFVAWWKAAALVVGAFLVLVPVLGALTPRAMSAHYVRSLRGDVARRLVAGAPDAERLRRLLRHLDRLSAPPS